VGGAEVWAARQKREKENNNICRGGREERERKRREERREAQHTKEDTSPLQLSGTSAEALCLSALFCAGLIASRASNSRRARNVMAAAGHHRRAIAGCSSCLWAGLRNAICCSGAET